ncbi:MAG TPA: hypothetical protein VKY37_13205 [Brumimicrobium sp.]|nr:hypothetical protein [Brumimicrobium sp.]
MDTKIITKEGVIYVWFDDLYFTKKNEGLSKKTIERNEIQTKIDGIFPHAFIEHESNGAPIIKGTKFSYISVSHYGGWFALYFSEKSCGVDIQTFKTSLSQGKDYFINNQEIDLNLSSVNLHLIWSAKEAFYKKHKGLIKDLKNAVTIKEIKRESELITLEYKGLREGLTFRMFEDFVIVWT